MLQFSIRGRVLRSVVVRLAFVISAFAAFETLAAPSSKLLPRQRGVSWVATKRIDASQLDAVAKLGADWIVQEPFGWQPDPAAPEIKLSTSSNHAYWGESDEGIVETARLARQKGIHTLLKPHLWLRGGGWVGDIRMDDDREWAKWFENYRVFILHYAALAEKNGIEALCIGTELRYSSLEHPERWRALIRQIRAVYHGRLTYAANWYGEYDSIEFWDALDFIGVQAYFPLSEAPRPSVDDLIAGWKPHVDALRAGSRRFGKPIVFTEIGYRSTTTAAVEPWSWPEHDGKDTPVADAQTQSRCFDAFFRAMWDKEWFGGAYIWKWYPEGAPSRTSADTDFTPQGKPAEKVIRTWYGKRN